MTIVLRAEVQISIKEETFTPFHQNMNSIGYLKIIIIILDFRHRIYTGAFLGFQIGQLCASNENFFKIGLGLLLNSEFWILTGWHPHQCLRRTPTRAVVKRVSRGEKIEYFKSKTKFRKLYKRWIHLCWEAVLSLHLIIGLPVWCVHP